MLQEVEYTSWSDDCQIISMRKLVLRANELETDL